MMRSGSSMASSSSASSFFLLLLTFAFMITLAQCGNSKVKLVSLLSNDAVLDRYAAAVAATEPLREDRDKALRDHMNPVQYWWMKATKGNPVEGSMFKSGGAGGASQNDVIRQAYTNHIIQSGRIIKSLGLSISDFNTITRRLAHDRNLRTKVLQQAYLYRLESTINDKLSQVPDDDSSSSIEGATMNSNSHSSSGGGCGKVISARFKRGRRESHHQASNRGKVDSQQQQHHYVGGQGSSLLPHNDEDSQVMESNDLHRPPHRLELFAKSLKEIEALRIEHTHQIQQEFKIDSVPDCVTRPEVFPVLNQKLQNLCLKFPLQAEEIAHRNGFEVDEFNTLLAKARKDPIFRWRVNRHLGKIGGPRY